jgi:menaquinone-dependent protoporphyrinogen oxidase
MEHARTRTLVAYDSRLGSTAEVAQFIGSVLAEKGAEAEVRPLADVDDLEPFDRVMIGSAIRYDRWLPDATEFVTKHKATLSNLPVSFFFTCLTLANPTPAALRKAEGYAEGLRCLAPEVRPASVGGFAGVLQFSRTPWPARLVLRLLSITTGIKEGDYRDWNAIRTWTLSQVEQSQD